MLTDMIFWRTVSTWYQNDVSYSLELIKSFVEGVEFQAEQSIERFEKEKRSHSIDVTGMSSEIADYLPATIESHQGLTDESWDLRGVFGEFFPSLQRRSALVTLCSYFECELDKLCLLYRSEKGLKLNLSDLRDKGVYRSTSYLEKVAGLDVHKNSDEWKHIKSIHTIRNIIVHRNGRLQDGGRSPNDAILEYIDEMALLGRDQEIILKKGYLAHVVDTYGRYFQLLGQSISAHDRPKGKSGEQSPHF